MTLSHQRLSMQLVLAAVKYLKSSMCFRALINQGIAETNLKIKNIQRVKGRVISYCSPAIFAGYSRYTDLLPNNIVGGDCLCMDRAAPALPWGKAGRAQSPAVLSMHFGVGEAAEAETQFMLPTGTGEETSTLNLSISFSRGK